jgi:hypothetical protein
VRVVHVQNSRGRTHCAYPCTRESSIPFDFFLIENSHHGHEHMVENEAVVLDHSMDAEAICSRYEGGDNSRTSTSAASSTKVTIAYSTGWEQVFIHYQKADGCTTRSLDLLLLPLITECIQFPFAVRSSGWSILGAEWRLLRLSAFRHCSFHPTK